MLRQRNYLLEGKDFKKGSFEIDSVEPSGKRYKKELGGYILGHIGIGKQYGRSWDVFHIPSGTVVKVSHKQLTKLGLAQKYGRAVYKLIPKTPRASIYDVKDELEFYFEYLVKGGDAEYTEWNKKRRAR